MGALADLEDLFFGEWKPKGDVISERVLEYFRFLGEERDGFVELIEGFSTTVYLEHETRLRNIEAAQQGQEGTFPAAAFPDKGYPLSTTDGQMKVVQTLGATSRIIRFIVGEIQPAYIDGSPVGRKGVGTVRTVLFRISFTDDGGRLDIRIILYDIGVLPGDILEYAGELVDKAQAG